MTNAVEEYNIEGKGFESYNWSENISSKLSYDNLLYVTGMVILFTYFRYLIQDAVKKYAEENKIVDKTKSTKFSESAWKLLSYGVLWTWGAALTLPESYFWDSKMFLHNWPNLQISDNLKWFYLAELAYYLHGSICHLTIEVRRKDFVQMLAHHVITIFLIASSFFANFHYFGAVLLFLHDINDVILESGKMFIYAGYHKVSDTMFLGLILCWTVTRLILYPAKIIYTALFTSLPLLYNTGVYKFYVFINLLLISIQCLNVMWFGMMIRLLLNVILKKDNVIDSREDEDEDEDEVVKSKDDAATEAAKEKELEKKRLKKKLSDCENIDSLKGKSQFQSAPNSM